MPDSVKTRPSSSGAASSAASGVAVDRFGDKAFDPSENVKALNEAVAQRQDDLRESAQKLTDAKLAHLKEIAEIRATYQETIGGLREEYQEKIAHAEAERLNSIRQVDREEVAKTAIAANTAITTLAKQTTDLATTLQKTVSDTAAAAETRNSTQYSDTNKRLSALELSSSEGKGKQVVVDPQMERLTLLVESMARKQEFGTGAEKGTDKTWGVVSVIIALMLTVGGIISTVVISNNRAPTVITAPTVPPTR